MNWLINSIKWIFGALSDENKNTMSLTRVVFLMSMIVALKKWDENIEIQEYFYYFILINLSYLFFKYKALDLISKIFDVIISSKKPVQETKDNKDG